MSCKTGATLLLLACIVLVVAAQPACRFAPSFTTNQLISDPKARDAYLQAVMYFEGMFGEVAVNPATGFTYDGTGIDYSTGEPASPLHYWSASSKESIHLMLLARAIYGDRYAKIFFSHQFDPNDPATDAKVLSQLERKMASLEQWNRDYPGFGGWIPWVNNNGSKVVPMPDWSHSVPALDNGEMVWGLYACQVALSQRSDSRSQALAQRLETYLALLRQTARTVFYAGDGHIRAVATIKDPQAQPTDPGNYGMNCDGMPWSNCYLDDPYEGEMFAVWMDLYSAWPSPADRESVWVAKRAKLQAVTYQSVMGPVTVQRGWWFSSHEQWKYLELPYLNASSINRRVFLNGERARTLHSAGLSIPGLYASVTDVCPAGQLPPTYISATGIQTIAFQPVMRRDILTPYGAYPVMLADLGTGLAWYNTMLKGSAMQGPLGSTEAINVQGTMISPVVTWDSKITSVAAMLGGVADIVQLGLERDGKLTRFSTVIDREWNRVFQNLEGENIDFSLPTASVPHTPQLNDFITCQ
jgi:hypothetical protein